MCASFAQYICGTNGLRVSDSFYIFTTYLNFCQTLLHALEDVRTYLNFYLFKNLYTTNGAQMRKLANPTIKKVGTSFMDRRLLNQIFVRAEPAHSNISIQNILSDILSTITYTN